MCIALKLARARRGGKRNIVGDDVAGAREAVASSAYLAEMARARPLTKTAAKWKQLANAVKA